MAARTAGRALRALGWTVLWVSAVLGVVMAGVAAFAASSFGRPVVAGFLVAQADAALAGRIALTSVQVLPRGGIELRGLEVYDPDGHLVLQVSRARLTADLTRLRSRVVGVVADLDHPSVLLESEPGGGVSLARAFAPAHPSPTPEDGRAGPARPTWTFRLTRLTLRDGDVWWQDEQGVTSLEASGVDLDAEASYGPQGGFLELRGQGTLAAPVEGASTLTVAAHLDGDALTVPVLVASVGATRVEGLGEADLARRSFRAAVTRIGLTPLGVAAVAPEATLGGALTGSLYAESDGTRASAALAVSPAGPGGAAPEAAGGRARAAVAVRLPWRDPALGFDVASEAIDPSRLVAQAPPGRVTLTARGAAAGPWTQEGVRGRVDLALAPSRLRGGEVGPVTLRGGTERGAVTLDRGEARLPGLTLSGSGRWRAKGSVAGTFTLDATDLALAGRNLTALGVPGLPPLGGRAHAQAAISGTAAAPALRGTVEAPAASVGTVRVEGVRLQVEAAGPLASARGRVTGGARRLVAGGTEVRTIALEAGLAGDEAALTASALMPHLGTDPVSVKAGALLAEDRRTATLRELSLSWPGTRYVLSQPAQVTFAAPPGAPPAGPTVDRLELSDGPRTLLLSGGVGPEAALDARLEVRRFDLGRLPRGLAPDGFPLAGLLDATAHATGPTASPRVEAKLTLAGGAVGRIDGLDLAAGATWDAGSRQLAGEARLVRGGGGTLELSAQLSLPLPARGARAAAPERLVVSAAAWPIALLRRAAGADWPLDGTVGGRVVLSGTAGSPTLEAQVAASGLTWEDLGPFDATVTLAAPGEEVRLTLEATHAGARLLTATASLPLDVAALLARPGPVARGLGTAPLTATLDVPGADLAPFAGLAGLPEGLAGRLGGTAALTGMVAAPRGTVALTLRDGVVAGWREVDSTVEAVMEAGRTAVTARATLGGEEALRLTGSLAIPPEGFVDPAALRRAALVLDAAVPPLSLERAATSAAQATGQVAAHLAVKGTLAAPVATFDLDAASVALEGRTLGDLTATARAGPGGATAELAFRATAGGALRAAGGLDTPLGIDADRRVVARAPARLRVTSEDLDLGFLPAVLPGLVRAAAGRLDVDLTAAGPLEELAPRGTLRLAGGRLAIAEFGDWTDLTLDARLGDHALEVPVLSARRGSGTLTGHLSLRDLGQAKAALAGKLTFKQFTLARAGMDIATLDLSTELTGSASPAGADVTVTVSPGTIKLPRRIPRTLQSLERRTDIVVGRPRAPRHAPALPGAGGEPFDLRLRLVIPGRVFVKSDRPRVDVEIKGDTTWRMAEGELVAEGSLEVVRGTVEPITGRLFVLERGKVQFSGNGYKVAVLDVVARYDNPSAAVTATIGGWLGDPDVKLTSRPALDDSAIAMLIATGRTELKTGTSEVGTLTGKDAGISAAGALLVNFARDLVSDKLPVDSFSVASDSIRTGKYLTDKLFVGYTRRFEARPEKGENPDEVRVEYQISPRWQLETRYGNAQSGGASLIWSRDY